MKKIGDEMEQGKVEISVVMPVYNGEEYLKDAIESILNQTFTNFEFIIVCEYGSNEESLEIVNYYANQDSRIRVVSNTERLGIAPSLNVGLKLAVGKYIARMDADDISTERRFEIQKQYMDLYQNIGICGIRHKVIGAPNWLVDYSADPKQLKCDLLFMSPLRHPSIMLRREIIEKYNLYYDESLAGVEDYELYIRASEYTELSNVLEDNLFYHRRTDSNLSLVYRERDDEIQTAIIKKMYQDKLHMNLSDDEIHRVSVATFLNGYEETEFVSELKKLNELLLRIFSENEKWKTFDSQYLQKAMEHRWMRARYKIKMRKSGVFFEYFANEWRKGDYYKKWMN